MAEQISDPSQCAIGEQAASGLIDVMQMMRNAKDLPVQQFDLI